MTWNQETVWIRRWGGVAQGAVPEHIPLGMFSDALNYQILENGALAPRMGFDLLMSASSPDGTAVKAIFPADMDGTTRLLVATSRNVYEVNPAIGGWTSIYAIPSGATRRMLFALLNANAGPLVVFGDGNCPLQKWDGTTVSACTGAPVGRPVAYKNYLAVFNIPGSPGRVQFSALPGDPDTWTSSGVALYVEMQGAVTSAVPFGGGLVVATQTRAEFFPGDPQQVLGMAVLSANVGVACHETVADCGGILTWLSQSGVMAWDGGGAFPSANLSNPDDSAHPEQVSSRIQRDIDKIDWTQIADASGVFDPNKQRYLLSTWIQEVAGGFSESRTFAYEFRWRAWHPWSLEATALAMLLDPGTNRTEVIAGTTTGYLRRQGWSRFKDETTPGVYDTYDYWAKSGAHDLGDPNSEKIFRAITIGSNGTIYPWVTGTRTVLAATIGEFYRTSGGNASVISPATGFILGTSVLGDVITNPTERYWEKRAPIAMRAKHITWRFFNSGSDNTVGISAFGISFVPSVKRPILVGKD